MTKHDLRSKIIALEKVMDERDRLYKERVEFQKTAVDSALAAAKEQTAASFVASEKAIVKAEEAQKTYNQGHNDLSRKMEVQYATMVPQTEARIKWEAIDKAIDENRTQIDDARNDRHKEINDLRTELMREIGSLRESRSESGGKDKASIHDQAQKNWSNSNLIVLGVALFGWVITIIVYVVNNSHIISK